jgi:hypothetical protein
MMTDEAYRIERTLWCLHTIGPDDVNAAPDFDTAVRWAAYHNAQTERYTVERGMQNDPHWPFVRSVVAIWPGTAEAHAEDLPKSIAACSPPTPEPAQPTEVLGDYPMEPMQDVAPVFVRQLMLQAMAAEYAKATGEGLEDMMDAARATWDTNWETDPQPRTMRFAIEAAQSDLQHWDEA